MPLLALLGGSAVTCAALLRGRRPSRGAAHVRADGGVPGAAGVARVAFASGMADVAAEVRDALTDMAGEAGRHLVQLEMAVPPDLAVRTDLPALRGVLRTLVGHAIRQAQGGRVLLSAARRGGRVEIAVLDDGAGAAGAVQEAALRDVMQAVALQGGTVEIEALAGEGTVVSVRLPEPMPQRVAAAAPSGAKAMEHGDAEAIEPGGAEALCWDI